VRIGKIILIHEDTYELEKTLQYMKGRAEVLRESALRIAQFAPNKGKEVENNEEKQAD
jgi:hypothetical protein